MKSYRSRSIFRCISRRIVEYIVDVIGHCCNEFDMAPMTDEDLEWFKSTFRPIPKPQLPEDCIEYSIFVISQNAKAQSDNEVRDRLREVQKASTELQRSLVKHYVWQRESYTLELTKENGEMVRTLAFRRARAS